MSDDYQDFIDAQYEALRVAGVDVHAIPRDPDLTIVWRDPRFRDFTSAREALQPYHDAIRAGLERHWLDWAHSFLREGDIDAAVDTLVTAAYELRAHDDRVARERVR